MKKEIFLIIAFAACILHAENLGSIPPNSGLLIIEDGSERYEVRFKGDMEKSSAVKLRRKQ